MGPAKNRIKFTSIALAFLSVVTGCKDSPKSPQALSKIVIGVQPNEKDRDLGLFRSELSKRLGLEVETVIPKDYEELVKKFKEGQVDFAFFTPITFILAEREADAKVLMKRVYGKSEFYYSAVLVKGDSSIRNLEALKGKRFGFVDPKSTSGFLYPRVILKKAGFDPLDGPHEFLGTHRASVQALLDGKVDAIGVWSDDPSLGSGAWTEPEFGNLKPGTLKVLAASEPIPNDAFTVRQKFYEQQPLVVFKVMEAMIGLSEDPARPLKKVFNIERMATATSRHYDSVRAIEGLLTQAQEKKQ